MPTALMKKLAASADIPIADVEHKWERAKDIVSSEYGLVETNPRFWSLVTTITKKMLNMKTSTTFKEYINRDAADNLDDWPREFTDENGVEWHRTGKQGTRTYGDHRAVAEYQSYAPDGSKTGERCWRDLDGTVYPD